jgi:hypothetical protein
MTSTSNPIERNAHIADAKERRRVRNSVILILVAFALSP